MPLGQVWIGRSVATAPLVEWNSFSWNIRKFRTSQTADHGIVLAAEGRWPECSNEDMFYKLKRDIGEAVGRLG